MKTYEKIEGEYGGTNYDKLKTEKKIQEVFRGSQYPAFIGAIGTIAVAIAAVIVVAFSHFVQISDYGFQIWVCPILLGVAIVAYFGGGIGITYDSMRKQPPSFALLMWAFSLAGVVYMTIINFWTLWDVLFGSGYCLVPVCALNPYIFGFVMFFMFVIWTGCIVATICYLIIWRLMGKLKAFSKIYFGKEGTYPVFDEKATKFLGDLGTLPTEKKIMKLTEENAADVGNFFDDVKKAN